MSGSPSAKLHSFHVTVDYNQTIEQLIGGLQALEGLEHAHNVFGPGKGLVHRDLSPHNLLLSGSGAARIAKIGDYGLAKAFDSCHMRRRRNSRMRWRKHPNRSGESQQHRNPTMLTNQTCKLCGRSFADYKSLGRHLWAEHQLTPADYSVQVLGVGPKCCNPVCDKPVPRRPEGGWFKACSSACAVTMNVDIPFMPAAATASETSGVDEMRLAPWNPLTPAALTASESFGVDEMALAPWKGWAYGLAILFGGVGFCLWWLWRPPAFIANEPDAARGTLGAVAGAIAGFIPVCLVSALVRAAQHGRERRRIIEYLRGVTTLARPRQGRRRALLVMWTGASALVCYWFIIRNPEEHHRVLLGHSKAIRSLQFSADGRRLISAEDGSIRVWDVVDRRELLRLPYEAPADRSQAPKPRIAISPDGRQAAFRDFKQAKAPYSLRDLDSGKELRTFPAPEVLPHEMAHDLAWTAAGLRLLVSRRSPDNWKAILGFAVRDLEQNRVLLELPPGNEAAYDAFFVAGGRLVLAKHWVGRHQVRLWDTATGALIQTWEWQPEFVSVSANGRRILGGSGSASDLRAFDVVTGKELRLDDPRPKIKAAALSNDGRWGLVADHFGIYSTLRLWSIDEGRELYRRNKDLSALTAAAFSPNGAWAAAGNEFGRIYVWRAPDAQGR